MSIHIYIYIYIYILLFNRSSVSFPIVWSLVTEWGSNISAIYLPYSPVIPPSVYIFSIVIFLKIPEDLPLHFVFFIKVLVNDISVFRIFPYMNHYWNSIFLQYFSHQSLFFQIYSLLSFYHFFRVLFSNEYFYPGE